MTGFARLDVMALDLGLTTHQLLPAMDGVVSRRRCPRPSSGRRHRPGALHISRRGRLPHSCSGSTSLHLCPHWLLSNHLEARFALGLATGQEWSHIYYTNGGAEIAWVEVLDWLAEDPELLAPGYPTLVKQCEPGFGYPVAVSGAQQQAVITGHDRGKFCRLTLMLLEQRGLSTPKLGKAFSKRRPWAQRSAAGPSLLCRSEASSARFIVITESG